MTANETRSRNCTRKLWLVPRAGASAPGALACFLRFGCVLRPLVSVPQSCGPSDPHSAAIARNSTLVHSEEQCCRVTAVFMEAQIKLP